MSILFVKGESRIEWMPKTASTAFSKNSLVASASGYLIPATASTDDHFGVILKDVVATDSDYATVGAKVPLLIPNSDTVFECDVTGTLTVAMVGTYLDLSTALVVDAGASANKAVLCVGFISATKGLFKINSAAQYENAV